MSARAIEAKDLTPAANEHLQTLVEELGSHGLGKEMDLEGCPRAGLFFFGGGDS